MHLNHVADAAWMFAASAPSKVPFYVAGVLLACWAFGIAGVGIARPRVARSARAGRIVMATTAVLVAATVTTAVTTAGEPSESEDAEAQTAPASTLEIAADPSGAPAYDRRRATVDAGAVTIRFDNPSIIPHNVTIARDGRVVAATRTIDRGAVTETANLGAGDYAFYCTVANHRQAGMRGTLTVR